VFGALAVIPAILYNLYGYYGSGFLKGQEGGRILPHLLTTRVFWNHWYLMITGVFGTALVVAAIAGLCVARGQARVVGLTLLGGYVAFGLTFTYHYATHSYYHLPFMIVLASGVGFLVDRVVELVRDRRADPFSVAVATVVGVVVVFGALRSAFPLVPPVPSESAVVSEVRVPVAVGRAVNHSSHVIALAPDYGTTLAFYGRMASVAWPTRADLAYERLQGQQPSTVQEQFDQIQRRVGADYFVVTDFGEWRAQPELRAFLAKRFPVVARGNGYLVYRLHSAPAS
jgi:hypothetical protein